MNKVSLIPFTCGLGASTAGCENGPSALDHSGIIKYMKDQSFALDWAESPDALLAEMDVKTTHTNPAALGSEERKAIVVSHVKNLAAMVEAAVETGIFPITFGGDHAMAGGSIAGLVRAKKAQGRTGLIWIDAHPDLNTPETSPSKSWHGMPVAALLGRGDPDFTAIGSNAAGVPALRPEHVCLMGIRDIDQGEAAVMDELPVRRYDMDKINDMGVRAAFEDALAYLAPQVDHICLSFDIDSLDPSEGLSTGTRVDNGFKKAELFPVLSDMLAKYRFDLLEIAEYNPLLEHEESTRAIIYELLEIFMNGIAAHNAAQPSRMAQ